MAAPLTNGNVKHHTDEAPLNESHPTTNGLNGVHKPSAETPHEENQYLELVKRVIELSEPRADRTGTGTLSIFAPTPFRFSLADNVLPLLTTKRVFTRGVIAELLFFLRGQTDARILQEQGVKIWDGNASREFLDSRGLTHRREGDLGPVYGWQWRHWGAKYIDCETDYTGQGVDQLQEVIRKIKENPTDRRIILSAWNPGDIPQMALPPCHMMCQFYVSLPPTSSPPDTKPKLSCLMYQRSADLGLGIPFNIASYALLTYMIAQVTGTQPHELIMQLGDAHVYNDHVEALKIQLERAPRKFPTLTWKREVTEIEDFQVDDFVVEGYKPHPSVPMKMSV